MLRQSLASFSRASQALQGSLTRSAGLRAPLALHLSAARSRTTIAEDVQTTHEVLDEPKFTRLRKALEADDRYRVTREEYIDLARKQELTVQEAEEFAKKLEDALVIMCFKQAPNWVFLKPERLSKHMHDVLDPDATQSQQAINRKTSQLEQLFREKAMLDNKKQELDHTAHKKANRFIWYCVGGMCIQAGAVARLTWWELSWDIMEPITYLITYSTGIMALMYFGFTRAEYTYESLHNRLAHRHMNKLYRKHNFDMEHYNTVLKKIGLLQQDLRVLGAPWTQPPHLEEEDLREREHICEAPAKPLA